MRFIDVTKSIKTCNLRFLCLKTECAVKSAVNDRQGKAREALSTGPGGENVRENQPCSRRRKTPFTALAVLSASPVSS